MSLFCLYAPCGPLIWMNKNLEIYRTRLNKRTVSRKDSSITYKLIIFCSESSGVTDDRRSVWSDVNSGFFFSGLSGMMKSNESKRLSLLLDKSGITSDGLTSVVLTVASDPFSVNKI